MATTPQDQLIKTPENMAEALKLGYDAQQASETLREVGSPWEREKSTEAVDEAVRYKVSPKKGELSAKLWRADGKNWTLSADETNVTKDTPFVATNWTFSPHGSHGLEFIFYSNGMDRDESGDAVNPVWQLSINAKDLDNITVIEEQQGEVVSEWLGRHAIFGSNS